MAVVRSFVHVTLQKFLPALTCIALAAGPALPAGARDANPPFPISGKLSRSLQTVTGLNFLTERIAGAIAGIVLRHELGGKVKVKVRTFSLTDLVAGKFKSVDVTMERSAYRGVPLGSLHIEGPQPIWVRYLKHKGQKTGLLTPVMVKIEGTVSERQLAKALACELVASKLRMIKLDLPGLGEQQLQLLEPNVDFRPGTVAVQTLLVTQGADRETGVKLTVEGKPTLVGDARIVLEEMNVSSPDIESPQLFSSFAQQLLNPLVDFSKMDRRDHAFRMSKLKFSDDRLEFSGNLVLAPKQPALKVAAKERTKR